MSSVSHVTIRPESDRIFGGILGRSGGSANCPDFKKIQGNPPKFWPDSRPESPVAFPAKIFFLLPFEVRTCPKLNHSSTSHINLGI